MKTNKNYLIILIFLKMLITSSSAQIGKTAQSIKEETVTYTEGGKVYKSYLAYDESVKGKRPAVLVVNEWWGLNDYTRMRARKLAELGYIAMAVDMFGNGTIAANPTEAQALTAPFYKDPQLAKGLLDAGIKKIK